MRFCRRTRRSVVELSLVAAAAGLALLGCSVTITDNTLSDGDSPAVTFTIGGKEFTLELGPAGIFDLAPGTEQTNIVDIRPFEQPPDDQPSSAAVRLRSTNVTVLPPQNAKIVASAADLDGFDETTQTGSVDVNIWLDVAGAANPCESGVRVGSFRIDVVNGVATGVTKHYDIEVDLNYVQIPYLRVFRDNNLSMCLKARSPFAGRVRLDGVVVSFGPAVQVQFEPPDPRDPAISVEACCRPPDPGFVEWGEPYQQLCEDLPGGPTWSSSEICGMNGGVPHGPGSTCATTTCNEDFRACCPSDPAMPYKCYEATHEFCTRDERPQYQDISHASGIHCNSDPRPCVEPAEPPQACCLPDSGCDDEPLSDGLCPNGGTPKGDGTSCATTTCPVIEDARACCFTDQPCKTIAPSVCDVGGGTPQGPGSTCATASCPAQPPPPVPTGACCIAGDCDAMTASACAAGEGAYSGDGTVCANVTCAQPQEFVVWYTGNVSCWQAPLIYISNRDAFEQPEIASSYPGGGIDPSVPLEKVLLQGGFGSVDEARTWICPQFESFFYHNWCSPHYLARGQWWLPGGLGCDLSHVPLYVFP